MSEHIVIVPLQRLGISCLHSDKNVDKIIFHNADTP